MIMMKGTCRLEKYASIVSRTHDPKLKEGHLKMMIMRLMMMMRLMIMMTLMKMIIILMMKSDEEE